MGAVVPFRREPRCGRCGAPGREMDLCRDGEPIQLDRAFVACQGCLERTASELAQVRPVFEAMIAAGVPRDIANETMTFLLGKLFP